MNIKVDKKYINIYKLFFEKLKEYGWSGSYKYETYNGNNGNNGNIINIKIISNSDSISLEDYLQKHKYMDYDLVEEMIVYLGSQLSILHKHGLGFLYFNLENISVLDDKYFIFNSFDELCQLDNKEQLLCNFPIDLQKNKYKYNKNKNNIFIAPELENNVILPIITNITSSYYSFGLLCVKCLGINDGLSLDPIYNTRIYYFLKRCLDNDPNKRYFLYL